MAYDVSGAPQEGAPRLAGWVRGGTGLKFFKTEEEAAQWLTSSLNAGERVVFRFQFGPVERMKLIRPPAPWLEPE